MYPLERCDLVAHRIVPFGALQGRLSPAIQSKDSVPGSNTSFNIRQLALYFGLLSLLVNLVNPGFLLDIPTSYMLKNLLHASAPQIALFRLLTAIPAYIGFVFGMVRDLWNPFGLRDRGYFRIFVPLLAAVLVWMALSRTTYLGLLSGMLLATAAFSFTFAAFQGLQALIGQEALMTGRLSALYNFFLFIPVSAAYFFSGFMSENLSPRQTFLGVAALTSVLGVFGFWKPRSVFNHTYDNPHAKGAGFLGDLRRLLKHRAIYPVLLINIMWNFTPGSFTPMQFFLTNQLHVADSVYAEFAGLYNFFFLPPVVLYGFLCRKFPPRKLLLWSVIVGIPQFIPWPSSSPEIRPWPSQF